MAEERLQMSVEVRLIVSGVSKFMKSSTVSDILISKFNLYLIFGFVLKITCRDIHSMFGKLDLRSGNNLIVHN